MAFGRKKHNGAGRPSAKLREVTVHLGERVEVVATQAHAATLLEVLRDESQVPVLAELRVEPYNPVGVQVVGVYVTGQMVGRLPRDQAELRRDELRAVRDARGAAVVHAVVRTGPFPLVTLEPDA